MKHGHRLGCNSLLNHMFPFCLGFSEGLGSETLRSLGTTTARRFFLVNREANYDRPFFFFSR